MRKLGVLLILVGLALAFGPAWFAVKISGEETSKDRTYTRSQKAWKPVEIALSESQNPLRIRVDGFFLPGGAYFGDGIPLNVIVRGKNNEVFSQRIALSTSNGNAGRPEGDREIRTRQDGTVLISTNTNSFNINANGNYQIVVVPDNAEADFSLSSVDVVVLQNVTEPGFGLKKFGYPLAGFGLALFFIGGRRKRRKRSRHRDDWEDEARESKHDPEDDDDDDDDHKDHDDDDDDDDEERDRRRAKEKLRKKSRRKSPWDAKEPKRQSAPKKSKESIWNRKPDPKKHQEASNPEPKPDPVVKPKPTPKPRQKKKPGIQWGRGDGDKS